MKITLQKTNTPKQKMKKILIITWVIISIYPAYETFSKEIFAKATEIKEVLVFKNTKDSEKFLKEEKEVLAIVEKKVAHDMEEANESKEKVSLELTSYDLNEDGIKEVFVIYNSSYYCGSTGCSLELYKYIKNSWFPILDITSNGEVAVLKNITKTFNDLALPDTFVWNGKEYHYTNQ